MNGLEGWLSAVKSLLQVVLMFWVRRLNNSQHRVYPPQTENLSKDAEFPGSCPAQTWSCSVPPKKCSRVMIWQHFLVPCAGLYPGRAILCLKHLPLAADMNCSGCHFLLLSFINEPLLCLERKTFVWLGFSFFSCGVIASSAAPVRSMAPGGAFLLVVHCAPEHSWVLWKGRHLC